MLLNLNEQNIQLAADRIIAIDPSMKPVVATYGYPPLWHRKPGFASLVHIILEQQVSLESAKAAFTRLTAFSGEPTPDNFLKINDIDLFQIGFSRQKKEYVRGLANAITTGSFDFEKLHGMSCEAVREEMKQLKGIGDWTADIYLTFCLLHPDILPKGDIALYEAIRSLKGLEKRPDYPQFEALTQSWRPWRSVGTRMLWHFYLCERGRS